MSGLHEYFTVPDDSSLLVTGVYDPRLVLLSVLTAIVAATMALQVTGHAASSNPRTRAVALASGSAALGGGVWAMHFIGMLAFSLCVPVHYDPLVTGLSILPSLAASAIALSIIGRPSISPVRLFIGGVAVGVGIGAMHYSGMEAMRTAVLLRYDPYMFVLSILVAVALAILALWIRFGLRSQATRLGRAGVVLAGGTVMGLAISGMHYVGMTAVRFVGVPSYPPAFFSPDGSSLAPAISLIVLALMFMVFAANVALRYRDLARELQANVARRRATEQALRDSEAQFRTLIDNIPGVAYRSSIADGLRTVFVSEAAESITGYPAEEFTRDENRRRFVDLILPEDMADVDERIKAAIASGTAATHEFRIRHRDGSIRWVWGYGRPVREGDGVARWFDGVIFDITDRRRIEGALREAKERAEQAVASRMAFVAKMSHEIRTPINSILGFTDVLLGSSLSPDQGRHLHTIRTAARSLLLLLNDVLDTAKLERGSMELEFADFNLLELAEELMATISATAEAKGIKTGLTYAAVLRESFHGDALRIRQILTNILGNAVKFTEHGMVRLTINPDGEMVHFAVRDTGIGIPPDRLEHIFDSFAQADASMSRRFGGTGLGTTISRQLVELMGGQIWAESEVGRGSTFHVRLSLAPARERPQSTSEPPKEPTLPPLRILVVDDAPMNTELMTILLQRNGHEVSSASGGAEALAAVTAQRFDIVLMDLMMPEIDGLETARRIRAAEAAAGLQRTPIVALSASVLDSDREAAQLAGMDGFATKPVELPALRRAIAAALGLGATKAA